MYSLWQDLSCGTIVFVLVTLTLKFDLLLKNFNLGHNFLTRRDIAHVYSLWQELSCGTIVFDLVTLTLKLHVDLLLKNFNLGNNFLTRRDRAFILHMCIPCDKTFHLVPYFLTSWPWPWSLIYFWKTLTLAITFLPEEIGLSWNSYCTCVFLVTRPFIWYHSFWPRDLDLEVKPTFEKL